MKKILTVLFLILLPVVFFWQYFFRNALLFPSNLLVAFFSPWNTEKYAGWNSIPFKGLGTDNLFIFYPMKTLLRRAILSEKSLPLWTPFNFTGGPLWGDGQSAPWYPLTYLYVLLPSLPDAFSVMVLLVPLLTLIFTYGCLRHFRLSRTAGIFGAVAFAFSGFMSVWMEENPAVAQSALWLPLLFWLTDLLITTPKRRWFALLTIASAFMMASGFLQIGLYELAFLAAYALYKKKNFLPFAGAIATGFLLDAPYLAVTWEAYKFSPRDVVAVPEIRSIFLVQWSHIFSLFNPDWLGNPGTYNYLGAGSYYDKALFIGVVPLVFALIGLFGKKPPLEKFLWGVVAGTLLMGFSSPFSQWLFSMPIPILSTMLPSRIFYLTTFALAVIAARQFDAGKTRSLRPVIAAYLSIIILLELFILSYLVELNLPDFPAGQIAHNIRSFFVPSVQLTENYYSIFLRNVGISVVLTALTVIGIRRRPFLVFLTVISAWYFTGKSLYFGQRQFVFPENPVISQLQRIAGIDRIGFANQLSRIPPGGNVVYGLYDPEGLNPVFPLRYGQLVKSAVSGGRLTTDIPRISVQIDLERAAIDATQSASRINTLMALLDMKYIVERKESGWYAKTFPRHEPAWEGVYFRIWKNPDTLPRAFIATNTLVENNPQKILDALYAANLRTTAIVEQPVAASAGTNSVTIDRYRMNDVTLRYQSSSNGLLVLTDNWAPGWRAEVDGVRVPVIRTDFTFRGVPVPAGNHTVYMYYWPQSLTVGIYLAIGGIILLLLISFTYKDNPRR